MESLEIVELLANSPQGLTIPEIVSCLQKPAGQVVRTIATLQQRRWLRPNARNEWIMGEQIAELSAMVPEH